ncbi:MAG: VWA domain-containing protein [Desulfarculaceae bacterium]|nr:VWA domain-containing protein [Desulfarculaceae bacterium]
MPHCANEIEAPRPLVYPFAAIAGQARLKLALLLLGVDLGLGGVLLRGEKGTAKSTAARGLASLLPPLPDGRPTPFVELPLGATEDRLAGGLDLGAAVKEGRLAAREGLLARADQGVLYVDEVNLLPPHLTHLVLDAAVSGVARLEREGLSLAHAARFALVASYNPEEGPLGPQLADRFGLCVRVRGEQDPALRVEVLKRRLAWEADPLGFAQEWQSEQDALRRRLIAARERLPRVELGEAERALAAELAANAGSQGQRGELATARAARALAAWQGAKSVSPEIVYQAADLALPHRRTQAAPAQTPLPRLLESGQAPEEAPPRRASEEDGPALEAGDRPGQERSLRVLTPGAVLPVATRLPAREATSRTQAGRRSAREVAGERGRYIRASSQRLGRGLALDATFRAAAPHQKARRTPGGPALVVAEPDIREKVRAARRGRLLLFCVDASGSMNAAARMKTTKAAVLGLLTEAYQKRDRVGLVAFGGTSARELLPPTSSVEVARRMLAELPTGGKTPLAAGLVGVGAALERELAADPKLTPLVIILTDGRPNVPLAASQPEDYDPRVAGNKGGGWGDGWGDGGYADREVLNLARRLHAAFRARFVVVDTDTGHHHEINLCRALAEYLGAACVSLRKLTAEGVLDLVHKHWE